MSAATDKNGASGPAGELVRTQLERILASSGFASSERLSRFLRFAVERTLQGLGDQLKEYSLGVEVFDTDTTVVFGSPVFFASPRHNLFLRLMGINDPARFRMDLGFQAMERLLGPPLLGPRYDYALMGDALALQQLTAFLVRAGGDLRAVPADRAVWDDLRGGNIVFLGAARMNPLLQRLPFQPDFELGPDNYIHNRSPQPGEQSVYVTEDHREMTYAVVARYPGLRPGRDIMVLTAHSEPGILSAVAEVTRAESARALAGRLGLSPAGRTEYYQLLLRVLADRGVPVKTEYVTHHAVAAGLR